MVFRPHGTPTNRKRTCPTTATAFPVPRTIPTVSVAGLSVPHTRARTLCSRCPAACPPIGARSHVRCVDETETKSARVKCRAIHTAFPSSGNPYTRMRTHAHDSIMQGE
ncbi:hypothetical protein ECG_06580 [Echinococcus granulosus]|nr:hypothetical protein ECG_06580 [Echinococcus granulosus]